MLKILEPLMIVLNTVMMLVVVWMLSGFSARMDSQDEIIGLLVNAVHGYQQQNSEQLKYNKYHDSLLINAVDLRQKQWLCTGKPGLEKEMSEMVKSTADYYKYLKK